MFKVKCRNRRDAQVFKIVDDNHNYLHSDGVVYPCGEYWPTKEQAQAVLDKLRPKHVWVHGDVFKYSSGAVMIYIQLKNESVAYCLRSSIHQLKKNYYPDRAGDQSYLFEEVEHLFNIKDKL